MRTVLNVIMTELLHEFDENLAQRQMIVYDSTKAFNQVNI